MVPKSERDSGSDKDRVSVALQHAVCTQNAIGTKTYHQFNASLIKLAQSPQDVHGFHTPICEIRIDSCCHQHSAKIKECPKSEPQHIIF